MLSEVLDTLLKKKRLSALLLTGKDMGTDRLNSFVHTQAKMKDSDLGGGTHFHGLPQPQFPKKSCRKVWCKLELMC